MSQNPYLPGQFCWVDLNSQNMGEAVTFYSDLFGWNCEVQDTEGGPPYSIFTLDGKSVAGLGQMSDDMLATGMPSIWNNYVQVEDCEACCAKVKELGGTVVMPTLEVLDAGSMAFIQDPSGAMLAIWQCNQHYGAEVNKTAGAFCWNELATRDLDRSVEFYGELFGWTFSDNPDSPAAYKMIENQGQSNGGMMKMDENWGTEIPAHWTVYFAIDDVDASADTIKRNGGNILHGPFDAPPIGRIAICCDQHHGGFNLIQFSEDYDSA